MSNEFKLVPVEPTDEMIKATKSCDCLEESWSAMLAAAPQPPALGWEPEAFVREVFLRNGFTIKDGQDDLKPYVYAAAKELTAPLQAEITHQKNLRIEAQDFADQLKARCDELEKAFRKLRDVAHGCEQIASSYSPCIDSVEEHGGDEHEDPSCAIHHRLYYAMFDADAALSKPVGSEKV